MLSLFDTYFKFKTPRTLSFFFSLSLSLGTQLLAVTLTFGEAYVIATKQTFFSKTRGYYFSRRFRPLIIQISVKPGTKYFATLFRHCK